jgi:TonB-linked SusC/RagA family outer membrane protein
MKLTILLVIATCLHASAHVNAQKHFTMTLHQEPVDRIFTIIQKKTGYRFFYNYGYVKKLGKADLVVTDALLTDILDKLLDGRMGYRIIEPDMVVITDKEHGNTGKVDVSGTVYTEKGEPFPGVSIQVKGTRSGVVTNERGDFSLSVPEDALLEVSYVGYETQQIAIQGRKKLTIRMNPVSAGMNEVVVVGYGTSKKMNLTGSLATLDMKDKENTPITNASQALHGMPGLWVNQAGAQPGADGATIRIRGIGTLNNNDPLVLVDGIEYDLNEINPAFIDNITVLKDASAAIYGSRAANGVILVTTKMGKKGKMQMDYNFSYAIQKPTYLPDVVWDPIQYMQMKDQAEINEGKAPASVDYTQAQIDEYKAGMVSDPLVYPNMNWFDRVLKDGNMQQHNLHFSGGSDKVAYNIGLGYMDQDGILIAANHANRYTLNISVSANVTDRLKVGADIVGNYRVYTQPAFGAPNAMNYYFTRLMRVLPIFGTYTHDGRYASTVFSTPGRNTIENPIMLLKEGSYKNRIQRTLLKLFSEYKLPFDVRYNINLGVDRQNAYTTNFVPYLVSYNPKTLAPNNFNINPASNNWDNDNLNLSFYQTLNWDKGIGDHRLGLMAGSSYNNFGTNAFNGHAEGYFDNTLSDLAAGSTNMTTSGSSTKDVLVSYFGRLNYSYKEKYLLEGILRYDGSSRFADGHRWGTFPSVSAGWRIDKESFVHLPALFDLLKLRASWGKLGNQAIPLYSYLNTVNIGANYSYSFNNTVASGAAVTAYNDPNLSWETTTDYNGGMDVSLWKGMLQATFDVFKRRTSGILMAVKIPAQIGNLTGPTENVGVVDNTGYEIGLVHRNSIGDVTYEIGGNISFVKNNVVSLRGQSLISTNRITEAGHPINSYYLYQATGIYQDQAQVDNSAKFSNAVKPGYLQYRDVLKDGKLDGSDRIIVGSSSPKYTYGFNLNVGYKHLSLISFWQGVQGGSIYPSLNFAWPFNNGAGVTKQWINGSWTPANTHAKLPILTTATGATENYQPSTFWLRDASYLRMKDLQLRYDLPSALATKLTVHKIAVFVNANNLVTIAKYKDFDPEKNTTNDNLYEYPSVKTFSCGVNVTF